jgi:hypothetical protein
VSETLYVSDVDMFTDVVSKIRRREVGTDDAIEALDRVGYFGEPFEAKALKLAKRVHVRRMFRKVKDRDGMQVWYHLKKTTARGKEKNFYKQLPFFTKEEYEYVATDFHERGQRHLEVRDYVLQSAQERGIHLDLPFPL